MATTTTEMKNGVYKVTYTTRRDDPDLRFGVIEHEAVFLAEYVEDQRGNRTSALIVLRASDGKNIGYGSNDAGPADAEMFNIVREAVLEHDRRAKTAEARNAYNAMLARFNGK